MVLLAFCLNFDSSDFPEICLATLGLQYSCRNQSMVQLTEICLLKSVASWFFTGSVLIWFHWTLCLQFSFKYCFILFVAFLFKGVMILINLHPGLSSLLLSLDADWLVSLLPCTRVQEIFQLSGKLSCSYRDTWIGPTKASSGTILPIKQCFYQT